jgi:hypothetical protein
MLSHQARLFATSSDTFNPDRFAADSRQTDGGPKNLTTAFTLGSIYCGDLCRRHAEPEVSRGSQPICVHFDAGSDKCLHEL